MSASSLRDQCGSVVDGHLQMQRANLPKPMCSQIFENVKQSVELDFNANMHRKGHMGSVRVDDEAGTLQLRVLISGATSSAAIVKDLKQLSGKLDCDKARHSSASTGQL